MFKELQVFPLRTQKLPSLAYSKEELEQQFKEQARLNRFLRKAQPFQFESIPHDVFDVLKTDLTQPTLQKKTAKTLSLFPVPQISIEKEQPPNTVVNSELTFDIDEYRAKRRRLLEPSPPPRPQEQVQTNGNGDISQQQQETSPTVAQPQQQTPPPAPTSTTVTVTKETTHTAPIDTTNKDMDSWYPQTDVLSTPTYTYPVSWVPLIPTSHQIAYCEQQSRINSALPSQYFLAYNKILEHFDYPLNRDVSIEEETLNEHWNSSEKLKLLKGVIDRFTNEDMCIAVLTADNDGEGVLSDLLENSGYETSRICNVITDDVESEDDTMYGVVFYTDKSKVGVEFDNGVDVAFIMDPRILRDNTKKNITTLCARHDNSMPAPVCYLVTMGSVEERALKWILKDSTRSMTEKDIMNAMVNHGQGPLDPGGANVFVLANLLSWLEKKSKLDYTYRSRRELPGSTLIEPVGVEEQPSTTTTEPTATTTTTTTEEEEEEEQTTTTTLVPVDTTTTSRAAAPEDGEINSDMDVSSEEGNEDDLSDYIKAHIGKVRRLHSSKCHAHVPCVFFS
jgi:hypothetical protein